MGDILRKAVDDWRKKIIHIISDDFYVVTFFYQMPSYTNKKCFQWHDWQEEEGLSYID